MMRFRQRDLTRVLLVVGAIGATAACSKGDQGAASDSTERNVSALASRSAPAAQPRSRAASAMPGALTKPIDDYSGDEFNALTQRLTFAGGKQRARTCRKSTVCDGSAAATTSVRIDPVVEQDSVGGANIPPFGVVQVRATNLGKFEEARYGFRPDTHMHYFMLVMPGTGGAARWRLEELDTRATPRTHRQVATGAFTDCGHDYWKPGARIDFVSCAASALADSVVTLELRLQPAAEDPLWISCATGCCIFT